jgi:hypothetical protein
MSIFSWIRSRRTKVDPDEPDGPRSLIRTRYETPKLEEVERDAAADVAAIEEDDKYFDPDSPGNQNGL